MEEVDEQELHVERVAALDPGKAVLEACVRVPHESNVRWDRNSRWLICLLVRPVAASVAICRSCAVNVAVRVSSQVVVAIPVAARFACHRWRCCFVWSTSA
jgi:hypothetical protein